MFWSVFSHLSALCSSGVKLLFGNEADCKVEVTLLLMLSLIDSDSSCWRDRTATTLDTIASVGICLGVTECCKKVLVFRSRLRDWKRYS